MKKLVVVIVALALAVSASAQEKKTRFGIGVSLTPLASVLTNAQTIEVYVPIDVSPTFRVEPSLGVLRSESGGASETDVTLGAGVFLMKRMAQSVSLYYGGRLKLNYASADDGVNSDSGFDVSIAGALGGEYYLVPSFSIGLEGQLGFFSNSDVNGDVTGFFTTGLGFLRLYF